MSEFEKSLKNIGGEYIKIQLEDEHKINPFELPTYNYQLKMADE